MVYVLDGVNFYTWPSRVINFSLGDLKCAVALKREFQFTNMEKNTSFDVL